jgi:hypothetical protein
VASAQKNLRRLQQRLIELSAKSWELHLDPIFFCALRIIHHLRQQRHPHATRFKVKFDEMYEAIQNYRIRLELEFLSRRTRVKFEQATLATVMVKSEHVVMHVARDPVDV